MTQKEVQALLDSGLRLGVTKPVDSPDFLGWILVSKHPSNPRIMGTLDESEDARLLEEQRQRERTPYLILNIELNRSVHEAGTYETEGDYRMKAATWCKNLDHVEEMLSGLGVELDQLRESREIDAP
jgi:hypothetical protein